MRAAAAAEAAPASPSAWAAAGSPPSPTGPSTASWPGTWAAWGPTRWVSTLRHGAWLKAGEVYGACPWVSCHRWRYREEAVRDLAPWGLSRSAPMVHATGRGTAARSQLAITPATSWHEGAYPRGRRALGSAKASSGLTRLFILLLRVLHVPPAAADQGHHVRAAQRPGGPAQPAGHREGDLEPQAHHHFYAAGERNTGCWPPRCCSWQDCCTPSRSRTEGCRP